MKNNKLTLFIHHSKTHKIMNKTWKTILQVIGYVVARWSHNDVRWIK